MSNPIVEAWRESQGLILPPIGEVDPSDNPIVRAWRESQGIRESGPGRGYSLFRSLPLPIPGKAIRAAPIEEQIAASQAFLGSFAGGFLRPIAAALGFTGAIARGADLIDDTDRLLLDRAAETVLEWEHGVRTASERKAIELGFSEEEIRGTRMLGEVVGYIAPGLSIYKWVGRLLGVSTSGMTALPFMSGLKVDVVSGLVWGGVFTPGELEDRFKNAAIDGGLSAGVGLVLGGLWPALSAYRNLRIVQQRFGELSREQRRELLAQLYRRKRAGELGIRLENEAEARSIFELMSEESFFLNSPAGQRILRQSADESALIQAIIDVAGARASGGVVRSVGETFEDVVALTDKFRAQFPGLKFQEVRNPEGGFDVIFGTKGLSNAQRKHYTQYGRFPGQKIQHVGGAVYEYRNTLPDGRIVARTASGKEVRLKPENVTTMFEGVEPALRVPDGDALFNDFYAFYREKNAEVLNQRYSLTEEDMVQLAREGRLREEITGRRRVSEPNAVVFPEELSPPIRAVPKSSDPSAPNRMIWDIQGAQGESLGVLDTEVVNGDQLIVHWIQAREGQGSLGVGKVRRLIEDVVSQLEAQGLRIQEVHGERITGVRTGQPEWVHIPIGERIRRTGNEETWFHHPNGPVYFEDTFRLWVEARGLPLEGSEYVAMQNYFAQKHREVLLDEIKREWPEYTKLHEALEDEWIRFVEDEGLPLEARAAVKGFNAERSGRGWVLTDINTGARFEFANTSAAEEAIRRTVRGDRDWMGDHLPPGVASPVVSPSAVPKQPAEEVLIDALPDDAMAATIAEDLPTKFDKPTRDFILRFEDRTQIPLWRLGFGKIDEAALVAKQEYLRWGNDLEQMWKRFGIRKRKDAVRLAEYLVEVESQGIKRGSRLKPSERYAIAREMGLSQRDLQAIREYRRIMDAGFQEYGIDGAKYIEDYFGRILPYFKQRGVVSDFDLANIFPEGIPPHLKFFAEYQRTGHLSNFEMDIRLVAHKWFKAAAFKRHVDEPYQALAKMTQLRVKDLPKEQRIRLEKGAGRKLDDNETVLPPAIVDITREYLNTIRGAPVSSVRSVQSFFRRFWKMLGVEVDERVSTEFLNIALSTMYGSAMGLRPMLMARNHLQTTWNLYVRLGSKHFAASMEDAISLEGFQKAVDALAIRDLQLGGVPMNDEIFEAIAEAGAKGTGPFSSAVAFAINKSLALGRVSRKVAEKSLIPYGSGDAFSRAWAFHYQRRHTADYLQQLKRRQISEEQFYEKGLPFFDRAVREEFRSRLRYQGEENALDFIGKMAADETHFVYGMGNQPAWMQNPFGRFLGMFGTWPLNQKELYARIIRNGTTGQRALAAARTSMIVGAVGLTGAVLGVNMWNWMAPAFLTWTGGPGVDYAINLKRVIDAPIDQKNQALSTLVEQIPRLALPGQVLMNDIVAAGEQTDDPALQAFYILLGRPTEIDYNDYLINSYPFRAGPEVTPDAPTSISPPVQSAPEIDFGINLESLGLEPRIAGGGTGSSAERFPVEEILRYLGGNAPPP